jgi:glycosyltransferase involved in cell wall biosynthesis
MAIRVLQVLTTNGRRGAETSALLVRDELLRRGLLARAVSLSATRDPRTLDVPVLGASRLGVRTLRSLRSMAAEADVVIAHGSTTLPACSIALAGTGTPFVYVNIGDLRYWASGSKKFRTRALLRRPALVAARSERSAVTLREQFGVAPDRIVVVPNGRSAERFPLTDAVRRADARRGFDLPADADVVAWVGAWSAEKRPDIAVRAIAALPDAVLLVAGDGPLRAETTALADHLAPGRVRLLGTVDAVQDVYAAADLALLTSETEGLPGVLIEAGLTGLPSVATAVGFVSDIVEDGASGILVPAGDATAAADAIARVLNDKAALGQNAYERCTRHFSLEVVGQRWECLIREVAAQ